MRFVSWNVNGLRARVKYGGFLEFCREYSPDFICLQEIKMYPWQKEFDMGEVFEYWNPSSVPGVPGTAVFSKRKAVSSPLDMGGGHSDEDGRVKCEGDSCPGNRVFVLMWIKKEAVTSKPTWAS